MPNRSDSAATSKKSRTWLRRTTGQTVLATPDDERSRHLNHDEGFGVLHAAQTPGGCWAHFSVVVIDGFRSLAAGDLIALQSQLAEQENLGHSFRASQVWPPGIDTDTPLPDPTELETGVRRPLLPSSCSTNRDHIWARPILPSPALTMTGNQIENPEDQALLDFLAAQRDSVLAIVAGLDEAACPHRPVVPSGWTPAGLVEHLGGAEWHWFQGVVSGTVPDRRRGMRICRPMTRRQRSSPTSRQRRSSGSTVTSARARTRCWQ